MCLFRKRRKQVDRKAREIASQHDMLDDYLMARRHGLSPQEALEDFDLIAPDDTSWQQDISSKTE